MLTTPQCAQLTQPSLSVPPSPYGGVLLNICSRRRTHYAEIGVLYALLYRPTVHFRTKCLDTYGSKLDDLGSCQRPDQ